MKYISQFKNIFNYNRCRYIILVSFLYFIVSLQGCYTMYYAKGEEKLLTDKIQYLSQKEKINNDDSLAILKPFIFSYKRIKCNYNKYSQILNTDSFSICYIRDTVVEHIHEVGCYQVFDNYFGKKTKHYFPKLSAIDYENLYRGLIKLENCIHDSLTNLTQMNDSVYRILSKYSGRFFLLTHVTENDSIEQTYKPQYDWITCKLFIFDKKNRELIFYNYNINSFNRYPAIFCNFFEPTKCQSQGVGEYQLIRKFKKK